MDRLDQVLDLVRETTGVAKKEEKKANVMTFVIIAVLLIAVIVIAAIALNKYLSPNVRDIDDFDDDFMADDDEDDFFEDEEDDDIAVAPAPVVTDTEDIVSE